MSFTYEKIDPSCFNILPIRWDEDPASSLSTIGINFSSLDVEVCNLGFSAANIWNPLYNEFQANSADWDSVLNTVASFSACWQSAYITVREMSASWLSPISIVYPYPIPTGSFDSGVVVAWVQANFPVSQGGCVNYLNGQRMKVFTLEYATKHQTVTVRCDPNGTGVVQVKCIGIGYLNTGCGCSCKKGKTNCEDRYTNTVRGVELIVQNGAWAYYANVY